MVDFMHVDRSTHIFEHRQRQTATKMLAELFEPFKQDLGILQALMKQVETKLVETL